MSAAPLPPVVYEFWSSNDQRCLYVGKASTNPGDRIRAHFAKREPWALSCDWIRINWLQPGAPLDLAERARIQQLTPRGNKQHNGRYHDRVWALEVQRRHARAVGRRLPVRDQLVLVRAVMAGWVARAARALLLVTLVDVVLLAVWLLAR